VDDESGRDVIGQQRTIGDGFGGGPDGRPIERTLQVRVSQADASLFGPGEAVRRIGRKAMVIDARHVRSGAAIIPQSDAGTNPLHVERIAMPTGQNRGKMKYPGDDLFSQGVPPQVSSALESLTSVFGMGTGGSSPLASPG
jgi:hypothetical protein